jgi:ribosomal 50S subunit-associated protein YjgA (DUF615 family)
MLTDIRVGVIKAALQLTPEQDKLWPAVEEAIRARAETRQRRLAALGERMASGVTSIRCSSIAGVPMSWRTVRRA